LYELKKYGGAFEVQRLPDAVLDTVDAVKEMLAQQTQDIKQHVDRLLGSAATVLAAVLVSTGQALFSCSRRPRKTSSSSNSSSSSSSSSAR
jgi:hypothetical protein